MGIVKRMWDIQTNIQALREILYSQNKYVGHPRCTRDIQTSIEHFKEYITLKKRMWYAQNVRGTLKIYAGHSRCTWVQSETLYHRDYALVCMGIKTHADEGQTMSSGAGAPLVSDTACWFLLNAILKQLCNIKAIDDSLSV